MTRRKGSANIREMSGEDIGRAATVTAARNMYPTNTDKGNMIARQVMGLSIEQPQGAQVAHAITGLLDRLDELGPQPDHREYAAAHVLAEALVGRYAEVIVSGPSEVA